jgi:hypothetical protein
VFTRKKNRKSRFCSFSKLDHQSKHTCRYQFGISLFYLNLNALFCPTGFRIPDYIFIEDIKLNSKKKTSISYPPPLVLPCCFPPLRLYNAVSVDLGPLPFSLLPLLLPSAVHILCPTTHYFFLFPFAPLSITSFVVIVLSAIFSTFCSSNMAFSSLLLYSSTPWSSHILIVTFFCSSFARPFPPFFHGSFLLYLFFAEDGPSQFFLPILNSHSFPCFLVYYSVKY